MITIEQVETTDQIESVRDLVREFAEYALTLDHEAKKGHAFADLEKQLAELPGIFGPPTGALLLVSVEGRAAGCAAYFGHDAKVCEVKRMYVKPEFRGLQLGEKLVQSLIEQARLAGYQKMVLNTFYKLKAAQALYAKFGFAVCSAYIELPDHRKNEVVFMEREI
ncbi:MAG: GNAT family N-acetyltransferase [Rhizobiaceae bacterium]|nr:GNAT family N-acetyltransferase [Rhizobiaceae bacterium]